MKLHVLFGQPSQKYDGEFGPEALVCWDEYCVDENPEGFQAECAAAIEKRRDHFSAFRVIDIEVDDNKISKILNATPVLKGSIA